MKVLQGMTDLVRVAVVAGVLTGAGLGTAIQSARATEVYQWKCKEFNNGCDPGEFRGCRATCTTENGCDCETF